MRIPAQRKLAPNRTYGTARGTHSDGIPTCRPVTGTADCVPTPRPTLADASGSTAFRVGSSPFPMWTARGRSASRSLWGSRGAAERRGRRSRGLGRTTRTRPRPVGTAGRGLLVPAVRADEVHDRRFTRIQGKPGRLARAEDIVVVRRLLLHVRVARRRLARSRRECPGRWQPGGREAIALGRKVVQPGVEVGSVAASTLGWVHSEEVLSVGLGGRRRRINPLDRQACHRGIR